MAVAEAPPRGWLSTSTWVETAPLTALVVTSDHGAREGWRIKLETEGYDVVEAPDAESALRWLVSEVPPDIAVLDRVHATDLTEELIDRLGACQRPVRTAILVSTMRALRTVDGASSGEFRLEIVNPRATSGPR